MIENRFVRIKGIDGVEIIEFPLEVDDTLSLEVLVSQFPYATGLKCVNKKNDQVRTVRKSDGKFFLSKNLRWNELVFFCYCSQKKRRSLVETELNGIKPRPKETIESVHCRFPNTFDLAVVGLSYDTTEDALSKYLSRFGELLYCKLRMDDVTNESRGTAYIRFKEVKEQNRCLGATHMVDKAKIVVKIPTEKVIFKEEVAFKMYAYNIGSSMTREDLRAYFSQFGLIMNIFRPYDHRNFAFITFGDQSSVDRTLAAGHHHTFNGGRVSVNRVVSKEQLQNGLKPSIGMCPVDNSNKGAVKRTNEDNNSVLCTPKKSTKMSYCTESQNYLNNPPAVEEKIPQNYHITPPNIENNRFIEPPNRSQYYPPYDASRMYNEATYEASTLMSLPTKNFVKQCTSAHNSGTNQTPPPQFQYMPSTSTFTAGPPSIVHQNVIVNGTQPRTSNQISQHNVPHDQSKKVPSQSMVFETEQSQLKNLVNQFIHEIKVNLHKFSKG